MRSIVLALEHRTEKWNPIFGLFRCSIKVLDRPLCVRKDARDLAQPWPEHPQRQAERPDKDQKADERQAGRQHERPDKAGSLAGESAHEDGHEKRRHETEAPHSHPEKD